MVDIRDKLPGEPLAAVRRPEWLRWTLVTLMGVTAAALLWLGTSVGGGSDFGAIVLFVTAALEILVAVSMAQAKGSFVILTAEGFYDETGELLCPMSEVVSVDSGIFALKPSKGFVVRLRSRAPRGWSPGLWWRLGRRFAVGGATPGRDGKDMAELLIQMIARRDARVD